jgi:thioredoxin-related protein
LGYHIIVRILGHMSKMIELKQDNLVDYFTEGKLLVMFSKEGCGMCDRLKKQLPNTPGEDPIVVVNAIKHLTSIKYYPKTIPFYPTLALYEKGEYKRDLTVEQVIYNQIY